MTNEELLALLCQQFGDNGNGMIDCLHAVGVNPPVVFHHDDDDVLAIGTVIQAEDKDDDEDDEEVKEEEEESVESDEDDDDDSDFLDEDDDDNGGKCSSQQVAGMKDDDNSSVQMEVVPGVDETSFGTQEDVVNGDVDGDVDGNGNYNADNVDVDDVSDDGNGQRKKENAKEDGKDASDNKVAYADGDDNKMDCDVVATVKDVDVPAKADIASVLAVLANLTQSSKVKETQQMLLSSTFGLNKSSGTHGKLEVISPCEFPNWRRMCFESTGHIFYVDAQGFVWPCSGCNRTEKTDYTYSILSSFPKNENL